MCDYVSNELFDSIEKNIIKYHEMFPLLPLKDLYWESILNKSLIELGHKTEWEPGSHKVGADVEIIGGVKSGRISCKGGSLTDKSTRPSIHISSYRTTRFKTLDEKLSYFDEGHEDVVFSLASVKPLKSDNFTLKYILSIFFPLKFSSMSWHKNGNDWFGEDGIYKAKITHKMSDQLWYKVPLDTVLDGREYTFD